MNHCRCGHSITVTRRTEQDVHTVAPTHSQANDLPAVFIDVRESQHLLGYLDDVDADTTK